MKKKQKRFSVSLPVDSVWMLEAVEALVEEREAQGRMCSKSEMIRELMRDALSRRTLPADE